MPGCILLWELRSIDQAVNTKLTVTHHRCQATHVGQANCSHHCQLCHYAWNSNAVALIRPQVPAASNRHANSLQGTHTPAGMTRQEAWAARFCRDHQQHQVAPQPKVSGAVPSIDTEERTHITGPLPRAKQSMKSQAASPEAAWWASTAQAIWLRMTVRAHGQYRADAGCAVLWCLILSHMNHQQPPAAIPSGHNTPSSMQDA